MSWQTIKPYSSTSNRRYYDGTVRYGFQYSLKVVRLSKLLGKPMVRGMVEFIIGRDVVAALGWKQSESVEIQYNEEKRQVKIAKGITGIGYTLGATGNPSQEGRMLTIKFACQDGVSWPSVFKSISVQHRVDDDCLFLQLPKHAAMSPSTKPADDIKPGEVSDLWFAKIQKEKDEDSTKDKAAT